ncbi:MAG: virulence factor [Alphaproteobacteria bacterium]
MAGMQIIYWRDIPTMVQIREGRKRFTANLPERFEKAVDAAAMRDGETSTDDYLAEFRRTDPVDVEGDLQAIADARAAELEAEFDTERLRALIASGGRAA